MLKTVANALRLLEVLAENSHMPTLSQLTQLLDLSKPSVHRLLVTLEENGFVRKDPDTRGYQLGLKLWRLGWAAIEPLEIRQTAHQYLVKLADEIGETALLAVLSERDQVVVYVDKVDPPRPITLYSRIGGTAPLHATSTGKVLLAFQSDQETDLYLSSELPRFTTRTITDPNQLRSELRIVRERGWSLNTEEWREGTGSVAAPVWGPTGELIAALAISMLIHHLQATDIPTLAATVVRYANEISSSLGYFEGVTDYAVSAASASD